MRYAAERPIQSNHRALSAAPPPSPTRRQILDKFPFVAVDTVTLILGACENDVFAVALLSRVHLYFCILYVFILLLLVASYRCTLVVCT